MEQTTRPGTSTNSTVDTTEPVQFGDEMHHPVVLDGLYLVGYVREATSGTGGFYAYDATFTGAIGGRRPTLRSAALLAAAYADLNDL